jgi:hypothetical protein
LRSRRRDDIACCAADIAAGSGATACERTPLTENLTGDALKTAFQKSGLFLEQGLASSQGANGPDLKAALIVFRQTVSSWLGMPAAQHSSKRAADRRAAACAGDGR